MKNVLKLEEKRNYNSIDLFKLLMAFAVVAIHTNPIVKWSNPIAISFVVMVEDWAVPFFYIASGFFLQLGMEGKNKEEQQSRINNYLIKIVKMYCVWTVLSMPLSIYGYAVSDNSIISCILSYIKYFLFVGKLYNSYHLYYLLATIYALFAIKILYRKNTDIKVIFIISLIIYIITDMFVYAGNNLENLQGIEYYMAYLFKYIFNQGGIFKGMIYFVIGMMIAVYKYYFNKRTCVIGLTVMAIITMSVQGFHNSWTTMIESTLVFMLLLGINLPNSKIWLTCRECSTIMYLSHLIFYSFYTFIVIHNPNKLGYDSFIVTVLLCLLNALIVIQFKQRMKKR